MSDNFDIDELINLLPGLDKLNEEEHLGNEQFLFIKLPNGTHSVRRFGQKLPRGAAPVAVWGKSSRAFLPSVLVGSLDGVERSAILDLGAYASPRKSGDKTVSLPHVYGGPKTTRQVYHFTVKGQNFTFEEISARRWELLKDFARVGFKSSFELSISVACRIDAGVAKTLTAELANRITVSYQELIDNPQAFTPLELIVWMTEQQDKLSTEQLARVGNQLPGWGFMLFIHVFTCLNLKTLLAIMPAMRQLRNK